MVGVCHKKLGLSGLCFFVSFFAFNDFASSSAASHSDGFYLGLSYSPAFSKIRDFHVANDAAETVAVFPYLKKSVKPELKLYEPVEFKSENFDWRSPNRNIGFQNSFFTAFDGNVGYKIGSTRVEFEVGYEKFRTQNSTGGGSPSEHDGIFLLTKELANSVLTGHTSRLTNAISKLRKKDMHLVSNDMNVLNPVIDTKLCSTSWKNEVLYSKARPKGMCLKAADAPGYISNRGLSAAFAAGHSTSREKVDYATATTIADDSEKLSLDEKAVMAAAFSNVEGAEVLQAHSIRTTSVMLNACHDFRTIAGLTPFACAGIGGDFVEVVDFSVTPKPAYQLKAGLSFNINDSISAFSSAFFHHVLGDGTWDVTLNQLVGNVSLPDKSKEFGVASFSLAYYGAEFGLRLAF